MNLPLAIGTFMELMVSEYAEAAWQLLETDMSSPQHCQGDSQGSFPVELGLTDPPAIAVAVSPVQVTSTCVSYSPDPLLMVVLQSMILAIELVSPQSLHAS